MASEQWAEAQTCRDLTEDRGWLKTLAFSESGPTDSSSNIASPLHGSVFKVLVERGQVIEEGDLVAVIEAMKMENEVIAHRSGVIADVAVRVGDAVTSGATLAVIRDVA
jgi:acetyl-CoA/propionyl-CoA carboxylase biotin carboxyl carrier protein